MNSQNILFIIFILCSNFLFSQQNLTETPALDADITKYFYLKYSETDDSLKTVFGARVRKGESLVSGPSSVLNELWQMSPSSTIPLEQLPPNALSTGLFLQYALVDQETNLGVARLFLVKNQQESLPIIYKIKAKNKSIEIIERLTTPKGLFWLVQNLTPKGMSNLRRVSFLKEAGISDLMEGCTDLTYGRTANLNCLAEGIRTKSEDAIKAIFTTLNGND